MPDMGRGAMQAVSVKRYFWDIEAIYIFKT